MCRVCKCWAEPNAKIGKLIMIGRKLVSSISVARSDSFAELFDFEALIREPAAPAFPFSCRCAIYLCYSPVSLTKNCCPSRRQREHERAENLLVSCLSNSNSIPNSPTLSKTTAWQERRGRGWSLWTSDSFTQSLPAATAFL